MRTANTSRRIFYYAPVATDALNERHSQGLHIGPADNKVFSVCRALKAAGAKPVIVSSVLDPLNWSKLSEALPCNGIPFVRAFSYSKGAARRVFSAIGLLAFTASKVRTTDQVLLYNFFPEFIPSALYLRLIGNRAVLDVEDGPRSDEQGLRGLMVRTSYRCMSNLVAKRHLVVSNRLAEQLNLAPALAVYGVADGQRGIKNQGGRFSNEEVNVLFGGAILPDTGLDLFVQAVRQISSIAPDAKIHFHITGKFDPADFDALIAEVSVRSSSIKVTCHAHLSYTAYRSLASTMDIGLCLKLPTREMGQTTFPSKVIEYASLGILICSTMVSDVPDIFDEDSALLLTTEDAAELADLLLGALRDRDRARSRAQNGAKLAAERFSPLQVGSQVEQFLLV